MSATDVASTLLTAAVVFASTNLDDIVLLSVLFADPQLPRRAIVLGQFLGIGTLALVSVVAALAAVAVPPGWTALLGAIPLVIGLNKLRARGHDRQATAAASFNEGSSGSAIGTVAGVTLANGADNLSVYIPLFAANRGAIGVYVCVFAALTAVWCWLGQRLVSHRVVGEKLQRYKHIVLPVVLIALGAHILSGARALWR